MPTETDRMLLAAIPMNDRKRTRHSANCFSDFYKIEQISYDQLTCSRDGAQKRNRNKRQNHFVNWCLVPPHSTSSFPLLLFATWSLASFSPLPLCPSSVSGVGLSRLTYFNIWRGSPPGRRTNRPTWQMTGFQVAQSAPVHSQTIFQMEIRVKRKWAGSRQTVR